MNKKFLSALPLQGLRLTTLLMLMLGLILGVGDSPSIAAGELVKSTTYLVATDSPNNGLQMLKPPVTGLVSTLYDEVNDLPAERIRWSTYWQLCWQPYPKAQKYELQTVTMEGKSPKLKSISDRCLRMQAASNENKKSQGLLNRELILLMHTVQLGYRVRAVLDDNRVSEWSEVMVVGATTSPQLQKTPDS
ncbi:MAG: hypothetical protein KME60_28230 [Cyanomargarita calcarea GSE-NOS-MK-12-04C]|uniref:Uncharacterized protein n=1 Tax=Cyanomargarita calcarea GSE-NOS-MK-12-04C TaxID=2839659 RepID=A0A951QT31_9CYAN|nr:hypothetical protein [Cyanomargarita calcarea GSE-NOS-MK-12-04C]